MQASAVRLQQRGRPACRARLFLTDEHAVDFLCSQGRKNHCVAVIGDGAITGGMAYEAMNHAGFLDKNMIVILNDNQQVRPVFRRFSSCL